MSSMDNAPAGEKEYPPPPETVSWGGPMPAPDGVWRRRTSDTMPEGPVWWSDGKVVWFQHTNGSPNAYSEATACLYWQPAQVPAAPTPDEIARMGGAA